MLEKGKTMIEKPPAFLLSCRDPDARELRVLVFDPNIETLPPPQIARTIEGHFSEENAARYLTYKMQTQVTARTMREWRRLGKAPASQCMPGGKHRWYRQADLDEFLLIKMRDDETDI